MKLNARQKMIPALAMLLVAAVTLTSASYAWFTMNKQVTATGIDLTAVAPNNLLISNSNDGGAIWASTTTITTKYTGKLKPASSVDGMKFFEIGGEGKINAGTGIAASDATITAVNTAVSTTDGYYADYILYIKNTGSESAAVVLDTTNTTVADKTTDNMNLASATRLAVFDVTGIDDVTADGALTGKLSTWYNLGRNGSAEGAYPAGITGPVNASTGVDAYKGVAEVPVNTGFTVASNTTSKILVRVWIEGQDKDCTNLNSGADFIISLAFKAA